MWENSGNVPFLLVYRPVFPKKESFTNLPVNSLLKWKHKQTRDGKKITVLNIKQFSFEHFFRNQHSEVNSGAFYLIAFRMGKYKPLSGPTGIFVSSSPCCYFPLRCILNFITFTARPIDILFSS